MGGSSSSSSSASLFVVVSAAVDVVVDSDEDGGSGGGCGERDGRESDAEGERFGGVASCGSIYIALTDGARDSSKLFPGFNSCQSVSQLVVVPDVPIIYFFILTHYFYFLLFTFYFLFFTFPIARRLLVVVRVFQTR